MRAIDDLRSHDATMTPGPWYAEPGDRIFRARIGARGHLRGVGDYAFAFFGEIGSRRPEPGSDAADAIAIAALRNNLPAIIRRLEAVEKVLALHREAPMPAELIGGYCVTDVDDYPCETVKLLGEETP